jgi:hypothetical protein
MENRAVHHVKQTNLTEGWLLGFKGDFIQASICRLITVMSHFVFPLSGIPHSGRIPRMEHFLYI